jgi:hypothetical protein
MFLKIPKRLLVQKQNKMSSLTQKCEFLKWTRIFGGKIGQNFRVVTWQLEGSRKGV